MVLADLIGRRRNDYRIRRGPFDGIDEAALHDCSSVCASSGCAGKMIEMRAKSMEHLGNGGLIALFPSGVVASSRTMCPAIEEEWNVFYR
jgi:hypothetical protein